MKKAAFLAVLLMLVLCIAGSLADEWRTEEEFWANAVRADYRSLGLKKKTTLPVFAAPGEDAYRGAKGKASVSLSEPIRILGETGDEAWQMIEYDVSKGARRVGWIRLPENAAKPDLSVIGVGASLGRMTESAALTDDPRGSGRALCTLSGGQEVAVLFEAADAGKSLLYIKTQIDGKKAAGFVPGNSCEPVPMYEIQGDTIVVREGVSCMGTVNGWWDYGEDGQSQPVWHGEHPADTFGRVCLSLSADDGSDSEKDYYPLMETRNVVLPGSVREITGEAFLSLRLEDFTIPEGLTALTNADAFYACTIGTLRIPAGLTDLNVMQVFTYTGISRFEVAEDNPVYLSRDGVLFSKDGKTLIAYPSGRKTTHYDVPAGTEVIGANAFRDDTGALPLVTISLPIGLREIQKCAFAECGELVSLVIPPTVKSIAEDAFAYCVSLQRLSLPAGFPLIFDPDWVIRDDFTRFNGDNGPTLTEPLPKEEWEE